LDEIGETGTYYYKAEFSGDSDFDGSSVIRVLVLPSPLSVLLWLIVLIILTLLEPREKKEEKSEEKEEGGSEAKEEEEQ